MLRSDFSGMKFAQPNLTMRKQIESKEEEKFNKLDDIKEMIHEDINKTSKNEEETLKFDLDLDSAVRVQLNQNLASIRKNNPSLENSRQLIDENINRAQDTFTESSTSLPKDELHIPNNTKIDSIKDIETVKPPVTTKTNSVNKTSTTEFQAKNAVVTSLESEVNSTYQLLFNENLSLSGLSNDEIKEQLSEKFSESPLAKLAYVKQEQSNLLITANNNELTAQDYYNNAKDTLMAIFPDSNLMSDSMKSSYESKIQTLSLNEILAFQNKALELPAQNSDNYDTALKNFTEEFLAQTSGKPQFSVSNPNESMTFNQVFEQTYGVEYNEEKINNLNVAQTTYSVLQQTEIGRKTIHANLDNATTTTKIEEGILENVKMYSLSYNDEDMSTTLQKLTNMPNVSVVNGKIQGNLSEIKTNMLETVDSRALELYSSVSTNTTSQSSDRGEPIAVLYSGTTNSSIPSVTTTGSMNIDKSSMVRSRGAVSSAPTTSTSTSAKADEAFANITSSLESSYRDAYGDKTAEQLSTVANSDMTWVDWTRKGLEGLGLAISVGSAFVPGAGLAGMALGGAITSFAGVGFEIATEVVEGLIDGDIDTDRIKELYSEMGTNGLLFGLGLGIGGVASGLGNIAKSATSSALGKYVSSISKSLSNGISNAASFLVDKGSDFFMSIMGNSVITGDMNVTGELIAQVAGTVIPGIKNSELGQSTLAKLGISTGDFNGAMASAKQDLVFSKPNTNSSYNLFDSTLKGLDLNDEAGQRQALALLEEIYPSTKRVPGRVSTLKDIQNLINSPEYISMTDEQRQIAQTYLLKSNPRIDYRDLYDDMNISSDMKRKVSVLENCLKDGGANNAAGIYNQDDFNTLSILAKVKGADETTIKQMTDAYNKAQNNGCMLVNNTTVNPSVAPTQTIVKDGKSYEIPVVDLSNPDVYKNPEKYGLPAGTTQDNVRLTVHMNDGFNKAPKWELGKLNASADVNLSATITNGKNALYGDQQVGIGLNYDSGAVGYASNYSAGTGFVGDKNISTLANARLNLNDSSTATFVRDQFLERMNAQGYSITKEDYAAFSKQFMGKSFSTSDLDALAVNGKLNFNGKEIPLKDIKNGLSEATDDLINKSWEINGHSVTTGFNEINIENPQIGYIYVRGNSPDDTLESILSPEMLDYIQKNKLGVIFQKKVPTNETTPNNSSNSSNLKDKQSQNNQTVGIKDNGLDGQQVQDVTNTLRNPINKNYLNGLNNDLNQGDNSGFNNAGFDNDPFGTNNNDYSNNNNYNNNNNDRNNEIPSQTPTLPTPEIKEPELPKAPDLNTNPDIKGIETTTNSYEFTGNINEQFGNQPQVGEINKNLNTQTPQEKLNQAVKAAEDAAIQEAREKYGRDAVISTDKKVIVDENGNFQVKIDVTTKGVGVNSEPNDAGNLAGDNNEIGNGANKTNGTTNTNGTGQSNGSSTGNGTGNVKGNGNGPSDKILPNNQSLTDLVDKPGAGNTQLPTNNGTWQGSFGQSLIYNYGNGDGTIDTDSLINDWSNAGGEVYTYTGSAAQNALKDIMNGSWDSSNNYGNTGYTEDWSWTGFDVMQPGGGWSDPWGTMSFSSFGGGGGGRDCIYTDFDGNEYANHMDRIQKCNVMEQDCR